MLSGRSDRAAPESDQLPRSKLVGLGPPSVAAGAGAAAAGAASGVVVVASSDITYLLMVRLPKNRARAHIARPLRQTYHNLCSYPHHHL